MSIFKKRIRMNSNTSATHEAEASTVIDVNAMTEDASINHEAETLVATDVNTTTENHSEVHSMDNNNNTIEELKDILEKRWEEQEDKESIPYEEMFQELVDEAVYLIKYGWKSDAKIGYDCRDRVDNEITLKKYDAFFVSDKGRKLYSTSTGTTYPKTNKSCFFETLIIPTAEEEQRFVDCVMAKLPPETKCEMYIKKCDDFFAGRHYTFTITFTAPKRS